jgi:hypothetical protein
VQLTNCAGKAVASGKSEILHEGDALDSCERNIEEIDDGMKAT